MRFFSYIISGFSIFICSITFAQGNQNHFRFWRGFKQETSTFKEFKDHISTHLVPATKQVGAGKGLVSYLPVFIELPYKSKPTFLPDETAIIQYESEAIYKDLAQTPEFRTYGRSHYEEGAFTKNTSTGFRSSSEVSRPLKLKEDYQPNKEKTEALHMGDVQGAWQNNLVVMWTMVFNDGYNKVSCAKKLINEVREHIQSTTVKGAVMLYDPNYLLIYERVESESWMYTFWSGYLSNPCYESHSVELLNAPKFNNSAVGLNMTILEDTSIK